MHTTQTMTTTAPAGFTREEIVDYLRTGLAAELPHLSCTVEDRDGSIHVTAVRA